MCDTERERTGSYDYGVERRAVEAMRLRRGTMCVSEEVGCVRLRFGSGWGEGSVRLWCGTENGGGCVRLRCGTAHGMGCAIMVRDGISGGAMRKNGLTNF